MHVSARDGCVGGVRGVGESVAPGFVAYDAEHREDVFGVAAKEGGLRDEGAVFEDCGVADFAAYGLAGVEEFGDGADVFGDFFVQVFVADTAADMHGVPLGDVAGEECGHGAVPAGFEFCLGVRFVRPGGAERGDGVGG